MRWSLMFLVLMLVAIACRRTDGDAAQNSATEFAKRLPGATGEVDCTDIDTDGDGYCSCTAFMADGTTLSLDCGCSREIGSCTESGDIPRGCKVIENIRMRTGKDGRAPSMK